MFSQHLANGLQTASITALVGVGFLIVYRTCNFFYFAHGIIFTSGAYCVFLLMHGLVNIPVFSIILAILFVFVLGLFIESNINQPLRTYGGSSTSLLIASLGVYTLVQNSISLFFGDDTLSFRWWSIEAGWPFFGARITAPQIVIIISSWIILVLTWVFIRDSSIGKRMKAVANDPELALIVGIDVKRVYLWAMGLGSALAGIAGILTASDVDIIPTMGMQPLMMGIVAAIIGGNTIWGTACGALLLGMAKHIGIIWIPTMWQDAITFIILLGFLLLRPQGFSTKQKKGPTV